MFDNPKVNFLIAGTQKGGTTSLCLYLRNHPRVLLPKLNRKELHFFDKDEAYGEGVDSYHANFDLKQTEKIWGEATPIYMYWDSSPYRISKYNPKMKIIILLRNPIERAYSHWNMEFRRGLENLTFLEAVKLELSKNNGQHRVHSYIDRGYYSTQISRLWSFFPKKQILIIKSEELRKQPNQILNKVYDFLELPEIAFNNTIEEHKGNYETGISSADRIYLSSIFEAEVRQLESILGWDCQEWLEISD